MDAPDFRVTILLAIRPGYLRNGLEALLSTIPQARVTKPVTENPPPTLDQTPSAFPDLIIVDSEASCRQVKAYFSTVSGMEKKPDILLLTDQVYGAGQSPIDTDGEVLPVGTTPIELYKRVKTMLTAYPGLRGAPEPNEGV